jgi:hypothetical protein
VHERLWRTIFGAVKFRQQANQCVFNRVLDLVTVNVLWVLNTELSELALNKFLFFELLALCFGEHLFGSRFCLFFLHAQLRLAELISLQKTQALIN